MLPTHLHVYLVYTVFLHRTLCLNGWEREKRKSQIYSKMLVKKLRPLFLLTKLIPYVAEEVISMKIDRLRMYQPLVMN